MHLECWLGNTTLTRKPSCKVRRNDSYTVRTYVADTGHPADPYFVGKFKLWGPPDKHGHIWTHGRFKGCKDRTPMTIGYAHQFIEPLQIPEWYANSLRRAGGNGGKQRWVRTAGGYIWLPDYLRFKDPLSILHCAMSAADRGELHSRKPRRQCWPAWESDRNVEVISADDDLAREAATL